MSAKRNPCWSDAHPESHAHIQTCKNMLRCGRCAAASSQADDHWLTPPTPRPEKPANSLLSDFGHGLVADTLIFRVVEIATKCSTCARRQHQQLKMWRVVGTCMTTQTTADSSTELLTVQRLRQLRKWNGLVSRRRPRETRKGGHC